MIKDQRGHDRLDPNECTCRKEHVQLTGYGFDQRAECEAQNPRPGPDNGTFSSMFKVAVQNFNLEERSSKQGTYLSNLFVAIGVVIFAKACLVEYCRMWLKERVTHKDCQSDELEYQ